MLLAGVYNNIGRYRIQIVKDLLKMSVTILNYSNDEVAESSEMASLTGRLKKDEADLIVGQVIINGKFEISGSYGDTILVNQLIEDINRYDIFNKINEQVEFSNGRTRIKIYRMRNSYKSVNRCEFLEYSKKPSKDLTAIHSRQLIMRSGSVRSLNELKGIYDLSWILNSDNSFKRAYHCITTEEDFQALVKELKQQEYVSFDLETNTLDVYYQGGANANINYINGIGLAWTENEAYYIPLESEKFEVLDKEYVCKTILPILETKKLIGANLKFDMRVCYHLGYKLKCHFDVIQAQFDIDPTAGSEKKMSIGLKNITRLYLNEETLELDECLNGSVDGSLIKFLDKDVITIYGCSDVDYALKLYHILKPEIQFMKVAFEYDMRFMEIAAISDYYGNYINLQLLKDMHTINKMDLASIEKTIHEYILQKAKIKVCKQAIQEMYGIEPTQEMIAELMKAEDIEDLAKQMCINSKGEFLNVRSRKDLTVIFVNILGYPTVTNKEGNYSFDSEYLERLNNITTDNGEVFLKTDLLSEIVKYDYQWGKEDSVLLSKEELEHKEYPFAKMLLTYRALDKRETAFFSKLEDENNNGWYNTTNNMISAETARIINPVQTLQGYMKKTVVSFPERYSIVFDLAQIEFRVMIGLASQYWDSLTERLTGTYLGEIFKDKDISYLVEQLNKPWADYHREGGCVLVGTTPAKMTKKERTRVKAPHFAIAYGGGALTIAKDQLKKAKNENEREKIINDAENILGAWRNKMYPLYHFLEYVRDQALVEITDRSKLPPLVRNDSEVHYGQVKNALGRRRFFDLDYKAATRRYVNSKFAKQIENMSKYQIDKMYEEYEPYMKRVVTESIRRSAGNYPIQSLAREFFVLLCEKLFNVLTDMGLTDNGPGKDEVIMNLFVHDECHLQVTKNHHPFKFYKIIYDNCMLNFKGYPRFYCGISVVDNWADGKDDKLEAPIEFVEYIIKEYEANPEKYENENWQENPKQYVFNKIKEWFHMYADSHIRKFTHNNVFDLTDFREHNENYFIYTNTKFYTDKFTNKEDDISDVELILLSHNTNKDLIVKTETRTIKMSEYKFEYEKDKQVNDEQLDDILNLETDTDLDDLIFNEDDFYDLNDRDNHEKDANQCYWLYSDEDMILADPVKQALLNNIDNEDKDLTEEKVNPKDVFVIQVEDNIIINLSQTKRENVETAVKFLQTYKTTSKINSFSIIWQDRVKLTRSQLRVKNNIDIEMLKNILYPKDLEVCLND